MSPFTPQVRGIFAFLKRYKIESFIRFNKDEYESVLIKFGLHDHWHNIKEREWTSISIMNPFTGNRNKLDGSIMSILSIANNQSWSLVFLDDLLDIFIKTKKIDNFDYTTFYQILVQCGYESEDIENMKFWENKDQIKKEDNITQDESTLGTIYHLENSLIYKIYNWIIENPSILKEKYPNIPKQIKDSVKKRDKYICQICGHKFKSEELQVDHIYPYSLGGSNNKINLMALCVKCNRYKSDSTDYYRSDEGKFKIMDNIKEHVKTLPMIQNFGEWLRRKEKDKGR